MGGVLKAAADRRASCKSRCRQVISRDCSGDGLWQLRCRRRRVSVAVPDGAQDPQDHGGYCNPGHVVNPAQIERQVASSFVYGLSAALYGEITVKDNAVEQTNFDSYNMRMDEIPKVETVPGADARLLGRCRRPTIAVAAPSVLNAIAKATGKRVRNLPLMHHERRAPDATLHSVPRWPARSASRRGGTAETAAGASSCTGCHAPDESAGLGHPRIAGRKASDIVTAMRGIAAAPGRRA